MGCWASTSHATPAPQPTQVRRRCTGTSGTVAAAIRGTMKKVFAASYAWKANAMIPANTARSSKMFRTALFRSPLLDSSLPERARFERQDSECRRKQLPAVYEVATRRPKRREVGNQHHIDD